MTLLEEIQYAAVDAKSDLGTLLRKCKVLAARLGSQQLEDWLIWESNGYPDNVDVPDYRIWPLELMGNFSGPFQSGIRNAPISLLFVPEKSRKSYERYQCRLSVANVENALTQSEGGMVQVSTGDLALVLGTKVYEHQNCVQAWAQFSSSNLVELLNVVRNRVLDFSFALWKEEPLAGEPPGATSQELQATKVTQIFNTTVYGGSANLVGSAQHSMVSFQIEANDFAALEEILRENDMREEDIAALRGAIDADPRPSLPQTFGPKVSSWIAAMMKKAADGSWQVGLGAAGNLLAQAISKYYGL